MSAPGSPSAPSAEKVAEVIGTPVLQITLRNTHSIAVTGGETLSVFVENTETGDKFGKTFFRGDLDAIVPEKLRAGGDVEELADLEYLLVECLRSECNEYSQSIHCIATVAETRGDDGAPEIHSHSQEIRASGKEAFARFEIAMRITKGLRGRPKTHTIELAIPLIAASTEEDKVRCT